MSEDRPTVLPARTLETYLENDPFETSQVGETNPHPRLRLLFGEPICVIKT